MWCVVCGVCGVVCGVCGVWCVVCVCVCLCVSEKDSLSEKGSSFVFVKTSMPPKPQPKQTKKAMQAQAKASKDRQASQGPAPTYQTNHTAQRMPASGQPDHTDEERLLPQNADKLYDLEETDLTTAFIISHLVFQAKETVTIDGEDYELYPGYIPDKLMYQTLTSCSLCEKVKDYVKPGGSSSPDGTYDIQIRVRNGKSEGWSKPYLEARDGAVAHIRGHCPGLQIEVGTTNTTGFVRSVVCFGSDSRTPFYTLRGQSMKNMMHEARMMSQEEFDAINFEQLHRTARKNLQQVYTEAKAALHDFLGGKQVTLGFDGGTINANGRQGIVAVCATTDAGVSVLLEYIYIGSNTSLVENGVYQPRWSETLHKSLSETVKRLSQITRIDSQSKPPKAVPNPATVHRLHS